MLSVIPSAQLAQNPLLAVLFFRSLFEFEIRPTVPQKDKKRGRYKQFCFNHFVYGSNKYNLKKIFVQLQTDETINTICNCQLKLIRYASGKILSTESYQSINSPAP